MNILHVEDSTDDAEFVRRVLKQGGLSCEVSRVDSREDFTKALLKHDFDVILSDCALPGFSGHEALKIARSLRPNIPFVFVSGTMGEEVAVDSLREGAADYVLKDRLVRLAPAVRRALLEAQEKRSHELMAQTLRHTRRLEAVANLAGGMARDFNNLLNIILGNVTLLRESSPGSGNQQEIAQTMESAAQRGAVLVDKLLAFARRSEGHFSPVDLNERVNFVTGMYRKNSPNQIRWNLTLAPDLPKTYGDPSQVSRMISNLVTNSLEAMSDGGELTISTSSIAGTISPVKEVNGQGMPFLCLEIRDTGKGMDEQSLKHIFEPFYTTKSVGFGTGLGLPEVYGLIKSHQGFMDIHSEPHQGTTVSLYFPVLERPPKGVQARGVNNLTGTESILVVEDEKALGHFLCTVLKTYGYHPYSAERPSEAMQLLAAHRDEIQLVISDVGLPEMDGFALCQELRRIKPELSVVVVSGNSDGTYSEKSRVQDYQSFIPKPYQAREILTCIRTVLDSRKHSSEVPLATI